MTKNGLYWMKEVAKQGGVRREIRIRWLRDGKIPESARDRNRYRVFTQAELDAIVKYANKLIPSPQQRQRRLALESQPVNRIIAITKKKGGVGKTHSEMRPGPATVLLRS